MSKKPLFLLRCFSFTLQTDMPTWQRRVNQCPLDHFPSLFSSFISSLLLFLLFPSLSFLVGLSSCPMIPKMECKDSYHLGKYTYVRLVHIGNERRYGAFKILRSGYHEKVHDSFLYGTIWTKLDVRIFLICCGRKVQNRFNTKPTALASGSQKISKFYKQNLKENY